jgi:hypothetical protein
VKIGDHSSPGLFSSHYPLVLPPFSLTIASSCALGLSMEMNGRKRRTTIEWL